MKQSEIDHLWDTDRAAYYAYWDDVRQLNSEEQIWLDNYMQCVFPETGNINYSDIKTINSAAWAELHEYLLFIEATYNTQDFMDFMGSKQRQHMMGLYWSNLKD